MLACFGSAMTGERRLVWTDPGAVAVGQGSSGLRCNTTEVESCDEY